MTPLLLASLGSAFATATALPESAAVEMAVRTPFAAREFVIERKDWSDLGVKDHRRYCVEVR